MANDPAPVTATSPPAAISKCWTDNSEPQLAEIFADDVVQAVMRRDGVTRQHVQSLAAEFLAACPSPLAAEAAVAIDPRARICYNLLPETTGYSLSEKHLQRRANDGPAEEETNSAA